MVWQISFSQWLNKHFHSQTFSLPSYYGHWPNNNNEKHERQVAERSVFVISFRWWAIWNAHEVFYVNNFQTNINFVVNFLLCCTSRAKLAFSFIFRMKNEFLYNHAKRTAEWTQVQFLDELKWHEILFNSPEWTGETWYFYLAEKGMKKLPMHSHGG